MKVIRKFQFTEKENEAIQTVKTMLQELGDDDYEMLLNEIHCSATSDDFYNYIFSLCVFAEKNVEESPWNP